MSELNLNTSHCWVVFDFTPMSLFFGIFIPLNHSVLNFLLSFFVLSKVESILPRHFWIIRIVRLRLIFSLFLACWGLLCLLFSLLLLQSERLLLQLKIVFLYSFVNLFIQLFWVDFFGFRPTHSFDVLINVIQVSFFNVKRNNRLFVIHGNFFIGLLFCFAFVLDVQKDIPLYTFGVYMSQVGRAPLVNRINLHHWQRKFPLQHIISRLNFRGVKRGLRLTRRPGPIIGPYHRSLDSLLLMLYRPRV